MRRASMVLVVMAISFPLCWSKPGVQLVSSLPSPQMVGTPIWLEAKPTVDGDAEKQRRLLRFRFSVSVEEGPFRILSDFNGGTGFVWRPDLYEHEARVKVTMRNTSTKESFESELPFRILPRANNGIPVVSLTPVPLVALFSSPPCPKGSDFRVAFHRAGDSSRVMRTNSEPCRGDRTNNIYVAGMRADSTYEMRAEIIAGSAPQAGQSVSFRTGLADGAFPPSKVIVPADRKSSSEEQLLLLTADRPTATDLEGNIVWYVPTREQALVRMLPGGRFLTLSPGGSSSSGRVQTLTELDLAGNIVRQTNMAIIAEQLEKRMGVKSICKPNGGLCIAGLHHDAIRLKNGHTIAIGSLERMFPEGAQGSEDPIDIMGTLLIDLDENLEVSWIWNAFDHLDVSRKALGDEKCRGKGGGLPCAPVYLGDVANDWLHGNAVSYSHKDGNLVLSLPEQDWVIKIDYQDGKGSGKVLWRLGEGGDLKSDTNDKLAWFSYQHDAAFEPAGADTLVLFDNGHRRQKKEEKKDDKDGNKQDKDKDADKNASATEKPEEKAHSRGQVWKIDEQARTATLLVNADLGGYAPYMGSAQRLSNGNFHFTASTIRSNASQNGRSVETTPDGTIVYTLETVSAYRSYRIADLYTPPRK
jgi:hypothetical protein